MKFAITTVFLLAFLNLKVKGEGDRFNDAYLKVAPSGHLSALYGSTIYTTSISMRKMATGIYRVEYADINAYPMVQLTLLGANRIEEGM